MTTYTGSGNDTLNGNAGDNILDGGTGADIIYSGRFRYDCYSFR